MFRLGTRTPGGRTYDLHRPDYRPDERAVGIGTRVLTAIVLSDLTRRSAGAVRGVAGS